MKKESIVLGLTGPTGAGKTTASIAMKDLGCFIINADSVAKQVLLNNKLCIYKLVKQFGNDIKDENGIINKKTLAKKAFSTPQNTKMLNQITHPYIINDINNKIFALKLQNIDIIVLDAPLLIESGLNKVCNLVVSVICDESTRLERIMKRDGLTKRDALSRMNAQKDENFYIDNSNYILYGNNRYKDLYNHSQNLIKSIREEFHVKAHI